MGLDTDFVTKLKNILKNYQPGKCRIELKYTQAEANAVLQFGSDWCVNPADELLKAVQNLASGKIKAAVCYAD